jgi:hypothetical protein
MIAAAFDPAVRALMTIAMIGAAFLLARFTAKAIYRFMSGGN